MSTQGDQRRLKILLVAPNVSRKMGGEALKALQIHQGLRANGHYVRQVAHARVKREMESDFPELSFDYIPDDPVQVWLNHLRIHPALALLNAWQLHSLARRVAYDMRPDIVHFTSPISPVLPYFRLAGQRVVIGPLNGNLLHPPALRQREPLHKKIGAAILRPLQALLGLLFRGKRAAFVLVSGGERTMRALRFGGLTTERMVPTLDSGISDAVFCRKRAVQSGPNGRFVFLGRLVAYKGCDLAIRALLQAPDTVTLDIIGDGVERNRLVALAAELELEARVRFRGWSEPGEDLYDQLGQYRGLVVPSLAEANGIVFQEAMVLGVPIICVDWGGPSEILTQAEAIMIEPRSELFIIDSLARALTLLSEDASVAEALSVRARDRAVKMGFRWSELLRTWEDVYQRVARDLPVKR